MRKAIVQTSLLDSPQFAAPPAQILQARNVIYALSRELEETQRHGQTQELVLAHEVSGVGK